MCGVARGELTPAAQVVTLLGGGLAARPCTPRALPPPAASPRGLLPRGADSARGPPVSASTGPRAAPAPIDRPSAVPPRPAPEQGRLLVGGGAGSLDHTREEINPARRARRRRPVPNSASAGPRRPPERRRYGAWRRSPDAARRRRAFVPQGARRSREGPVGGRGLGAASNPPLSVSTMRSPGRPGSASGRLVVEAGSSQPLRFVPVSARMLAVQLHPSQRSAAPAHRTPSAAARGEGARLSASLSPVPAVDRTASGSRWPTRPRSALELERAVSTGCPSADPEETTRRLLVRGSVRRRPALRQPSLFDCLGGCLWSGSTPSARRPDQCRPKAAAPPAAPEHAVAQAQRVRAAPGGRRRPGAAIGEVAPRVTVAARPVMRRPTRRAARGRRGRSRGSRPSSRKRGAKAHREREAGPAQESQFAESGDWSESWHELAEDRAAQYPEEAPPPPASRPAAPPAAELSEDGKARRRWPRRRSSPRRRPAGRPARRPRRRRRRRAINSRRRESKPRRRRRLRRSGGWRAS